jgi:uncharacterized protein (TIGR02246 family)
MTAETSDRLNRGVGMNATEAVAIAAIRNTIAAYNIAGDNADVEGVVGVFADDGVLELPGVSHEGRDSVREFFVSRRIIREQDIKDDRRRYHYLATSKIDVADEDTAKGETYFLMVRKGVIEQMGTYFDDFTRRDEKWLIMRRKVVLNWLQS